MSDPSESSRKHARDDASGPSQPRSKREKYTSNACRECKARKVKCIAEPICNRCKTYGLECVRGEEPAHRGPDKFKEMNAKIEALQEQVNTITSFIRALPPASTQFTPRISSASPQLTRMTSGASPIQAPPEMRNPAYIGPTSSAYGIDVAQSTLERDGITPADQDHTRDDSSSTDITGTHYDTADSLHRVETPRRLVAALGKEEAIRLIDVYQETTGTVYPCVDVDGVRNYAVHFFDDEITTEMLLCDAYGQSEAFAAFDRDLEILKIILAISLVVEGKGQDPVGAQLMDSVEDTMYKRFKIYEVDTKELLLLFLMSFYHFYTGEEILAYRNTGLAVRGCIEMGLHRRSTWLRTSGMFPGELQRSFAIKLFWCLYVLDRRWSLGTGMPFALQDSDIDTELPEPDNPNSYLSCMIAYGRLGSKVWKAVGCCGSSTTQKLNNDDISYLDFQIEQWFRSLPVELQLRASTSPIDRTTQLLRHLLHLRANQMRILVHRQSLLTKESMTKAACSTRLVIDLAKDTVRVVERMHRTSDMYVTHQSAFNYFLVSALSVLFLAVCHAPDEYTDSCRFDFSLALDLIKDISAKSFAAQRLWKTIRHVKHAGLKLGLQQKGARVLAPDSGVQPQANGKTSSEITTDAAFTQQLQEPNTDNMVSTSAWDWPEDSFQISSELSSMFKAAGGQNLADNSGREVSDAWQSGLDAQGPSADVFGFQDDEEFSRLMMDLL